MGCSIFKHGSPLLTNIQDLEQAKKEALHFVTPIKIEYIEVRDSDNGTVTIGYYDGSRFHWSKYKVQTEAWKSSLPWLF
jgi:hypothetical protein